LWAANDVHTASFVQVKTATCNRPDEETFNTKIKLALLLQAVDF
jgi:hypothetical protein